MALPVERMIPDGIISVAAGFYDFGCFHVIKDTIFRAANQTEPGPGFYFFATFQLTNLEEDISSYLDTSICC
jgi:hypothetical protein